MTQSASADETQPAGGALRAYLQLLRLPNVFTSMADVAMGYLLTHDALGNWPLPVALLVASTALYLAGMVLNDVFDVDLDARERPERPIPSGRIPLPAAARLGFGLLALGASAGCGAAALAGQARPAIVAVGLAALVVAYDRLLKSTPVAPLAMGGCRMLNVLLGMSAAAGPWHDYDLLVAAGIGLYIAGVTWFARTEADVSNRGELVLSTATMIAGIALVAWYPAWRIEADPLELPVPERWYQFWLIIAGLVAWRCLRAVADPRPAIVQMAVKNCILSLIVIDAAACLATRGTFEAAMILTLLIPATILGRWIYST
jgi:4-hydroxybenzoate polyprenyltransferase